MPNEYRNETDIVLVIKANYYNRMNTVCISFRITDHLYCFDHINVEDICSVFVPFPLFDVNVINVRSVSATNYCNLTNTVCI